MVCPSCGAQIDSPGKFCAKCGAHLPEAVAPVPPSNDFAAVPPPPQEEAPAPPPWAQTPAAPPPAAPPPAAPAWPQAPAQPAAPPPSYPAPQYGAPPYAAPQYGVPPYAAPQYGAPPYAAPQYGAPQYGAPQYGAPAAAVPAAVGMGMLAALLALAGGAAALGSAWLPWATSGSGDSYFKPIDLTQDMGDLANGYYLVAAGAVAAVCGLLLLLGIVRTPSARMLMSLGAIAGGAVVLAVEYTAYGHINPGVSASAPGLFTVSFGLALYVGAAGGAAAAVGGVLGLVSKR